MSHKINHANIKEWAANYDGPLFDGILCDPPYELGFMGKSWDSSGIAFDTDMWADLFKLVKPGGHLLAFSGSRTYHRMAVAIEDAGFEIRDMIEWVYGSGFPKSLNVGKSVNQLETNEWTKISKALDNIQKTDIIRVWKSNSNNVNIVAKLSQRQATVVGKHTDLNDSVLLRVVLPTSQEKQNTSADTVGIALNVHQATPTRINTVLQSVVAEIKQLQEPVKFVDYNGQSHSQSQHTTTSTAQESAKDTPSENMANKIRVEEALKTLRGKRKYSDEETISVLCAVLTENLLHTILSQSKTFQSLDTTSKTECASAITVTITEYMAECLTTYTVDIAKSKAVDKIQGNEREVVGIDNNAERFKKYKEQDGNERKTFNDEITKGTSDWEGYGTALKPAHEPCVLARKPIEGTVANNCLKYGTGGLAIDNTRIKANNDLQRSVLFEIIGVCQLDHLLLPANSVELKRFQDDTTNAIKKLCSVLESADTPTSEKTLGTQQEDIIKKVTSCLEETLTENTKLSLNTSGYGKKPTDEISQQDMKSTILTVSKMITDWKICSSSVSQLIEVLLTQAKTLKTTNDVQGRFPSNLIHDGSDEVEAVFPHTKTGVFNKRKTSGIWSDDEVTQDFQGISGDSGSASRYFYTAKASKRERNAGLEGFEVKEVRGGGGRVADGYDESTQHLKESARKYGAVKSAKANIHPTVKPLSLTKYLATLIKPPIGGRLLVPFSGSGSEMIGALQAGWEYVEGVELTEEYIPIAEARIKHWGSKPVQGALL